MAAAATNPDERDLHLRVATQDIDDVKRTYENALYDAEILKDATREQPTNWNLIRKLARQVEKARRTLWAGGADDDV